MGSERSNRSFPAKFIMSSPLRSLFFTFGMVLAAEAGYAANVKDIWVAVPCILGAWFMFYIKNKWR